MPASSVAAKLIDACLLSRIQDENVDEVAKRLQAEAALLGDLISEQILRTHSMLDWMPLPPRLRNLYYHMVL
jgi:hypothetical protein